MLPHCDVLNAAAVHKVEHFKVTNSASCQFPKGISHILFMFKATKRKNKILHLNVYLTKGCLSLFDYFIDTSPTLMSPFFAKKHVFFLWAHVYKIIT